VVVKIRGQPSEEKTRHDDYNGGCRRATTNDLDAFWLPFTPNRAFKRAPRLIARAQGMHYFTPDGRVVLDHDNCVRHFTLLAFITVAFGPSA
jgi:hypothetical protein